MATQIQIRRDTTAGWADADPILAQGELGLDTDLNTFKIGNGTAAWSELAFYAGSSDTIVPLPDFLTYEQGRSHLSTLNTNFGWNSEGLWFGPADIGDGSDSYPVFTDFTLADTDKVVVTFNVSVDAFCSDIGVCVYLDGTIPNWNWGVDDTRIAAQFNCPNPQIYGLTISEQSNASEDDIPNPGMYQVVFTYDPTAEAEKVIFQYFNGETQLTRLTLNEALPSGDYRIGFAADNNIDEDGVAPYRTYISDLDININNSQTTYSDTLQNGNSGGSVDIADFVFTYSSADGESVMEIHNHDMIIRTTRDDTQDADISIDSADDVWITSNDTLELRSTQDVVQVVTAGIGMDNQWVFTPSGSLDLPTVDSSISSGIDGTFITDSRTSTFYSNYQDSNAGLNNGDSVVLPVNDDTLWFAANVSGSPRSATITFADTTTVETIAVYDATGQGTAGVVFQWATPVTKTSEETYPLTVFATVSTDNNYVALNARTHSWQFSASGAIKFPWQVSNNRTGSGEVLKFSNSTGQSIITGPTPTDNNPTAQRLVIAGQDGRSITNFDGEGGDIYLWGGRGAGQHGDGGDIKIDGGNGGTQSGAGGYVKIRGGDSTNNDGGFVLIEGGYSAANYGGNITLSTVSTGFIRLDGDGGEFLNDHTNPANQIATLGNLPFNRVSVPTTSVGQAGDVVGYGAIDGSYIYYCTASYDGTTHIWKRVAWSNDTW